jgi:foldase protein PrsA
MGLAQLQKTEPARPAEFEEVQSRVQEDFNLKKKESIALEKAKSIKNELKQQGFEKIAKKYELEYKTAEEHQREQYLSIVGEIPEVDKLAFSLPLNEISDPINYNDGYIILHVLDRKEVTPDDFENNRSETGKNLLEVKKNKFFQSYYMKLREKIGVKTNYGLFTKINSEILARF